MKEPKDLKIIYSGSSIAKNTIYNLLGYGLPLLFALIFIPFLIKGLGEEKFGVLNIVWIVIGYFSFFDFGIGRAITQIIAEKIGNKQTEEIPPIFWTSFFLMLAASVIGSIILLFICPFLVYNFLNISSGLQTETLNAFYILAISIPVVTTTAGLRGVLEAYQKFGTINIIRTILGISSFLGPILCLIFTNSLFWIVLFLAVIRIVIWVLYLLQCFKLNNKIKNEFTFKSNLIKPIISLSGWMTVSNIIVPIIVYMDRFLIGALISAAAIAYYATPYEVVTKLLLIPGALTGVLFPAFSANYLSNRNFTKEMLLRAVKYTFILIYPVVLLIITFANEGMSLWLGKQFAENSSLILQFLALGILFNSMAYIPFTFLQGIKRPDIPAIVNLIELPLYLLAMWIAIKQKGINGAAFVWMVRMIIDSLILFLFAQKQISDYYKFRFKFSYLLIILISLASFFPILLNSISIKFTMVSIFLAAFSFVVWKYILQEEEKLFIISRIKIFNQ